MRRLLLIPLFLLSTFALAQAPNPAARIPTDKDPLGELTGTLVIHGGGTIPNTVRDRFIALAGGANGKLVVIPTASASADKEGEQALEPWGKATLANLSLLHTRDRKKANDPAFIKPLQEATAVWLGGGDQNKLTEAYRGTRVEEELHKLLKRGGVIGGTSAGAAVMSPLMIAGGNPEPRLAPGFGFLPGFIVDQHFVKRERNERLFTALKKNPGLAGLGIDEGTAIVVKGRMLAVVGNSTVMACLAPGAGRPAYTQTLQAGSKADLIALSRAAVARAQPPFPANKPPAPVVPKGTLIIGGGGGMPDAVWERFLEAAGGKDAPIVVVPTALDDPVPDEPGEAKKLKKMGATKVAVVHTRNRADSNVDKFIEPLAKAKGVWFSGGRQWRLVDSFKDTKAGQAFHDVLARGGVIGGSSAGASIQSDYMVRGDPLGNLKVSAEGYERGLGFLPGVAIDQHFFVRKRTADMTGLMQRYPQMLGIGLDEATAIVVRGEVMEVLGKSKVAVYDRTLPIPADGPDYQALTAGMRYNLKTRQVVEK